MWSEVGRCAGCHSPDQNHKDRVRVLQDVTVSHRYRDKSITLSGKFEYQACDDNTCYLPASVPVTMTVDVIPYDTKRR